MSSFKDKATVYPMKYKKMLLCLVLSSMLAGCGQTSLPATSVLGTSLPPKLSSLDNRLSDQIEAAMNALTFTKDTQWPCNFTQAQAEAYDVAAEQSIAHLLSLPETRLMSMDEITKIFVQGTNKVSDQTGSRSYGGRFAPVFLDSHNDYFLAQLYPLFCQIDLETYTVPHIEVFDRTGHFWRVGDGTLNTVKWMDDRWVAFHGHGVPSAETVSLVHIIQVNGAWRLNSFEHVVHGPGLSWFSLMSTPFYPDSNVISVVFLDSYRRIYVPPNSAQKFARWAGSPPCDFNDRFQAISDKGGQIYYWYSGEFYFDWDGNTYVPERDKYTVDMRFTANFTDLVDPHHIQNITPVSPKTLLGTWSDYCITF
jgi:hypothetical protein